MDKGNDNRTSANARTPIEALRTPAPASLPPPSPVPALDRMAMFPALWLATAFASGALLALSARGFSTPRWTSPLPWPVTAAAMITAAFGALAAFAPRRTAILAAFCLAGFTLTLFHSRSPTIVQNMPRLPCRAIVQGRVITPVYAGDALPPEPRWRLRAVIRATRMAASFPEGNEQSHEIDERLLVEGEACRRLRIGEHVVLIGILALPPGARFPHDFDYARYLRTEEIAAVLKNARLLETSPPQGIAKALQVLFRFRDACIDRAVRGLPPEAAALTAAAAFGYHRGMRPETRTFFLRSGLLHIFAVSGLHVGIFAGILLALARLLRTPYRARYLLLPLPLLFYVLLTGGRPAALRAWLMISLWCIGKGAYRAASPLNAVGLAALVLLILDPLNLLRVGFQYSFVVVLTLVMGWKWVHLATSLIAERRLWIPMHYRQQTWGATALRILVRLGGGSMLAWLGSIGLTAWYNGLFLPWNPLANAVAAPTAWTAVCLAFLRAISGFVPGLHGLHTMLGYLIPIPTGLLQTVTRTFGRPPFCIACGHPPPGAVVWFYGGLIALLWQPAGRWNRMTAIRRLVGIASMAWALLIMLQSRHNPPGAWVAVLAAGNGAPPVVVVRPHAARRPVMIDAYDPAACRMAAAWLRQQGWESVDGIVTRRSGERTQQAVAGVSRTLDVRWTVVALPYRSRAGPLPPGGPFPSPALPGIGIPVWREATCRTLPLVRLVRSNGSQRSETLAIRFAKVATSGISSVTITRTSLGETRIRVDSTGGSWTGKFHPGNRPLLHLWHCPAPP